MENAYPIMRLPTSLSSLILLISAAAPFATAAGQLVTDPSKCDCYLTNGTEAQFFAHHQFWDFRNQSQFAGVPPVITSSNDSAGAPLSSAYFNSTEWQNMWIMGNWNNSKGVRADASTLMVNSPNNVYIEANSGSNPNPQTWLTLRTQRLKDFQTAAEIESLSMGYKFLSVRMLARTIGGKGAITALFTYRNSEKLANLQEADLEVRTMDADNLIHYTNQPSYTDDGDTVPQATENATLADGLKWTDWAIHRLDWAPSVNTWFVDGKQVAQISFQTPRDPSKVILNAWSDGGQWAGNMSVGDSAYLQIQWFELVYNTTDTADTPKQSRRRDGLEGRADGGQCKAVCSIDETPSQGQPVMLWGGSTSGARRVADLAEMAGWIPLATLLVMFMSGSWR